VRLVALTSLHSLTLSCPLVSCVGLGALIALMRLTHLDLSGSATMDAGLARVVRLKRLAELSLHNCCITDAGVAQLTALRRITFFDVSGCKRVTVAGLGCLAELPKRRDMRVSSNSAAVKPRSDTEAPGVKVWRDGKRHPHLELFTRRAVSIYFK
jgi:hypothetical protein